MGVAKVASTTVRMRRPTGDLRQPLQVHHPQIRVGRGLREDEPGVGPDRGLEGFEIPDGHHRGLHAEAAQELEHELAGAPVGVFP
jgi:hypothetical protein